MLEADTGYVMTSYTSCLLFGSSEVWSSYLFKVVTPRRVIANSLSNLHPQSPSLILTSKRTKSGTKGLSIPFETTCCREEKQQVMAV